MFFNSRNGQRHFLRYFQHRFFVNTAKNEDAATLCWQRIDNCLDLTQRLAGVKLCLDRVFAAQKFQIGNGFETDHFVAAGSVDHQIAGDGEEIGPASGHIFPIFGGIGSGQHFGDHILQLMGRGKYPPQATTQRGFLWQNNCLEPF